MDNSNKEIKSTTSVQTEILITATIVISICAALTFGILYYKLKSEVLHYKHAYYTFDEYTGAKKWVWRSGCSSKELGKYDPISSTLIYITLPESEFYRSGTDQVVEHKTGKRYYSNLNLIDLTKAGEDTVVEFSTGKKYYAEPQTTSYWFNGINVNALDGLK